MELPIHVEPSTRPRFARWIPSVRAVALLSLGVGIGVLAAIPLGGTTALPVVVVVLAASAAVALALLFPGNVTAIGAADVLLGIAVMASVFGGLGALYVPLFLGFLAVTARAERPAKHAGARLHWSPAPEFERAMRPSLAAPTGRELREMWIPPYEPHVVRPATDVLEALGEPAWLVEDSPERPTWLAARAAPRLDAFETADAPDGSPNELPLVITANDIESEAWIDVTSPAEAPNLTLVPDTAPEADATSPTPDVAAASTVTETAAARSARHLRSLPSARQVMSAAVRARRAVGIHARIGFGNLREALKEPPPTDIVLPPHPSSASGATPSGRRLILLPHSEVVHLGRDEAV